MMERRTVSVRGGIFETEVCELGDPRGEPLLFLHPSNSLMIEPYLDDLAQRYRVIAPYHPGWGASTGLEHIDDPVDMAISYYDFLDALGIESAHVVGHSIGGMFEDMKEVQEAVWYDPECEAAVSRRTDMSDIEKVMAFMYENMQSLAAAAKFLWPIPDRGLSKRLHRVPAPALLLWGARDQLVSPLYAEEFRARMRDARIAILDRSAHFPMIEQREEFVATVTAFLSE